MPGHQMIGAVRAPRRQSQTDAQRDTTGEANIHETELIKISFFLRKGQILSINLSAFSPEKREREGEGGLTDKGPRRREGEGTKK